MKTNKNMDMEKSKQFVAGISQSLADLQQQIKSVNKSLRLTDNDRKKVYCFSNSK